METLYLQYLLVKYMVKYDLKSQVYFIYHDNMIRSMS